MTAYTINTVTRDGGVSLSGAVDPAATGNTFPNTGSEFLLVYNQNGSSTTLTIPYTAKFDGVTPEDRTYTINSSAMKVLGPFPPNLFNTGGNVVFAASVQASVRIYACRFTPETYSSGT